ncbi:hypothetical protein ABD91_21280 [Lysinibacillus sphaericus]|uniref:DUF7352 domain-containing protein n=1 Tax=Lysinibacillus sphaericus TaxID=1421 RepID=UPI0018CCC269|nr:hypothetical protein [Lysinibacillus sphaericus]MBG9693272.1 hypothetical protein [Lysinibacillus sphaericus]
MIKVHKYTLEPHLSNTFELPLNSKVLSLQVQHGKIVIYIALTLDSIDNVAENKETHKFHLVPTGESVSLDLETVQYLDTAMLLGGGYVLHVFHEIIE